MEEIALKVILVPQKVPPQRNLLNILLKESYLARPALAEHKSLPAWENIKLDNERYQWQYFKSVV